MLGCRWRDGRQLKKGWLREDSQILGQVPIQHDNMVVDLRACATQRKGETRGPAEAWAHHCQGGDWAVTGGPRVERRKNQRTTEYIIIWEEIPSRREGESEFSSFAATRWDTVRLRAR